MNSNFLENFRNKPREEWASLARESWTQFRIWVQENGELAAIGGLVAGLLVAYFFKLFVMLMIVMVLTAAGIWYLAPTAEELARRQSAGVSVNGHSKGSGDSQKSGGDQPS